jgi:23S rRNA (adenine2503-C2)-methyltransferase
MWDKIKTIQSSDLNVSKFVFEKSDAVVEAVLYKYGSYEERTVICCSVMSGCPIGCRFCGTGDYFVRNLTADEIVSQVQYLLDSTKVDPSKIKKLQIMTMSMGEPLLVRQLDVALRRLNVMYPDAALLISTSAPDVDYGWLNDLSCAVLTVGLQFSVHESTDEARNKLVPFAKKLTLAQIAARGNNWHARTGRRPYFNYCAHDGNDTAEDVARLLALFDPEKWNATISVICERDESVAAANARQLELATNFSSKMVEAGYNTRIFNPAGQDDIGGGCGMLHFAQTWFKENADKAKPSIGHGKPIIHAPTALDKVHWIKEL